MRFSKSHALLSLGLTAGSLISASLGACGGDPVELQNGQSGSSGSGGAGGSGGNSGTSNPTSGSGGSGGSSSGGTGGNSSGGSGGSTGGSGGSSGAGAGGDTGGSGGASGTGGAGTGGSNAGGAGGGGASGSGGGGAGGAGGTNPTSDAGSTGGSAGTAMVDPGTDSVPLDPAQLAKCSGSNPIKCTFDAPNGNYDITAQVGDAQAAGNSRLSAETKHYQGPAVQTAAGAYSLLTFTVNVRAEKHDGGQSAPADKLDVLIDGPAAKLHGIGFRAAPKAITLFFAGDSTACDWTDSNTSNLGPGETGWAQALSMYLKPGIAVANYADSGETAGGFYGKFFDPYATSVMKEGDYVFVEFGTNDSKNQSDINAYKSNLMKYVTAAKAKKATAVILTPVSRKGGTAASPGFQGLDGQARDFATAQGLVLIDMTALTRTYYASVADKNGLFVDSGTHFSETGAIGVAAVGAKAIKESTLPIKSFVK